jgi:hypothetical protein
MRVSVLRSLDKATVKSISSFVPRQRLCKQAPAATNTHNGSRIVGSVSVNKDIYNVEFLNNAKFGSNRPDTLEISLNVPTVSAMGILRTFATLSQGV